MDIAPEPYLLTADDYHTMAAAGILTIPLSSLVNATLTVDEVLG